MIFLFTKTMYDRNFLVSLPVLHSFVLPSKTCSLLFFWLKLNLYFLHFKHVIMCTLKQRQTIHFSLQQTFTYVMIILTGILLSQNKPFCSIYTFFYLFVWCCITLLSVIVPIELVDEPYTLFLGILVEETPLQNSQVFKL